METSARLRRDIFGDANKIYVANKRKLKAFSLLEEFNEMPTRKKKR
jgi:hypothetical protein